MVWTANSDDLGTDRAEFALRLTRDPQLSDGQPRHIAQNDAQGGPIVRSGCHTANSGDVTESAVSDVIAWS